MATSLSKSKKILIEAIPQGRHVLFYPGSGIDIGPLVFCATHFDIAAAIYADYETTQTDLKKMLSYWPNGKVGKSFSLSPNDLNQSSWDAFWFDADRSRQFETPSNAFGEARWLPMKTQGESTLLVFLRTEAVQTYANVMQSPLCPTIVVIQDHGYGGNWTSFGGENEMFEFARTHNALPAFLIVAENSEPWPGYVQSAAYEFMPGQMHTHKRAIYKLR